MFKTLLVPLDGSARAERILPHVEDIALKRQSNVVFLQVVESPALGATVTAAMIQERLGDFESRMVAADRYLAGIQGEFREKGITAKRKVESGTVVETIIRVADQESADLIAMASHGRGGLSRVFYGSVAAGILQQVDRPLLVIRARRL
ncbi:MAG: universal stress protein [Pseudomonadota bacterium]